MEDNKARLFLDRLIDRTLEGNVNWEQTADVNTFQAIVSAYVIKFSELSYDESNKFLVDLFNSSGDRIESYDDEMFDVRGSSLNEYSMYKRLAAAYKSARRTALGIDRALDTLIDELQGNPPLIAEPPPENDVPF